jgi:hypothetical protein
MDGKVLKSVAEAEVKRPKQSAKTALNIDKVAARYTVVAPYLRDNYGASDVSDTYSLAIAPGGKEIYGELDFGSFEG